jgi:hypothetical protein
MLKTVKGTIQVCTRVRDHLNLPDLKFCARRIARPRFCAAEVVADDRGGEAFVCYQAVLDGMAQVDEQRPARSIHGFAFVWLGQDLFVEDLRLADHKQPHVCYDVVGQGLIADVVAGNVQAESFSFYPAAIGKENLKVECYTFFHKSYFSAHVKPLGNVVLLNSRCITRRCLPCVAFDDACSSNGRMTCTPPVGTSQH